MVAVVEAMRWRGRGVVGGGGDNRETAASRSRWQLCWQRLKVLVGGGGDDVVDGGGSSSLPQKPGAGKKNQQTDLGKWGHRFVSKNKKQICEDKKQKKRAN